MIPQQISAPTSAIKRPTCFWRCKCGLAMIARRVNGVAELHYRGKRRVKCPHCGALLADQIESRS